MEETRPKGQNCALLHMGGNTAKGKIALYCALRQNYLGNNRRKMKDNLIARRGDQLHISVPHAKQGQDTPRAEKCDEAVHHFAASEAAGQKQEGARYAVGTISEHNWDHARD